MEVSRAPVAKAITGDERLEQRVLDRMAHRPPQEADQDHRAAGRPLIPCYRVSSSRNATP